MNRQQLLEQPVQFSSVAQSYPTICDPMNHRMPGFSIHPKLPEFTQTHVHWVSDAIQPSHPLSSPSPRALNLSQHQGLFKWISSSHQVAIVLEFHTHWSTANRENSPYWTCSEWSRYTLKHWRKLKSSSWEHSCWELLFEIWSLNSGSTEKLCHLCYIP